MAEVVLAAEVGRPTGSRAVRRLRREGKIPGVIYGHGTDPLPVAVVARELRLALNSEAGANQPALPRHRFGHLLALAREMQRHPVAQTVTHVDFVIVRRDEVISADVPIILVGEALEVHHGDGLVDQQMFTLAINALPTAIPSAIEADISELVIGGQVRVSDLTLPTGVTTDIDPETAVAIGQPPRVVRRGRGGRGRSGGGGRGRRRRRAGWRGVGRGGQRRGLGPAPPLCPVGAPGDPGGPARRRAGKPRDGIRREPAQRRVRCGRAAGRAPRRASARREGRGSPCRGGDARRRAGWRWPSRPPT